MLAWNPLTFVQHKANLLTAHSTLVPGFFQSNNRIQRVVRKTSFTRCHIWIVAQVSQRCHKNRSLIWMKSQVFFSFRGKIR